MRPSKDAVRGAFTLIEVLVVVGIIALLVAILIPSMNSARETSRRVACRSNQRQITMAMIFHAGEDKRGVYIYTSEGADDGLYYLYPKYFKDARAAVCPSTRNVVDLTRPTVTQKLPIGEMVKDASGAWPEQLARETYFPNLSKTARPGSRGYIWKLH